MELLKKYEDFLISNASQITSIEGTLRSITYFLPGRFHDAEFASQALFAGLNVLGLYHDSILRKAALSQGKSVDDTDGTPFNKYKAYWFSKSPVHKKMSLLLSLISYTQVVLEMAVSKKLGKRAQWKLVFGVELFKAALRLTLLQLTNNRMLLNPNHLQRDVDPAMLGHQSSSAPQPVEAKTWIGKKTGLRHPFMQATIDLNGAAKQAANGFTIDQKYNDVTEYLMSKVLTPEKLRKPEDTVSVLNGLGKLGEILYILRPLIYVLAIFKYGRYSWRPWLISLAVESASQAAVSRSFTSPYGSTKSTMTALEKAELNRRYHQMWFNLLRGQFYERFTRPRLEKFCVATQDRFLISIVAGVIRDYQPLWEKVYFYTSSS
ncbi:peroxisome membrane protein [Umbelopsis sp. PMI_123]|nr:peroxisome membrane protein [Umbelopsis sp. PMI_123]